MTKNKSSKGLSWQLCKPVIASALAISGVFNLVSTVLADTAAGTSISNTATATYNDPNDPDSELTATSNTVIVEVAEIAGITVAASGIEDVNGGAVEQDDELYYKYTVTNVGNDTTKFRIPNTADIRGPGLIGHPDPLNPGQLITDLEYRDPVTGDWIPVEGDPDDLANRPPVDTLIFAPGESVEVRVPITVDANAQAGNTISVQLGNTKGNGQNQPFKTDGGDVFTVDLPVLPPDGSGNDPIPGNGESDTTSPANGEREASAEQGIDVGDTSKIVPLVQLEKTISDHQKGDLSSIEDDIVEYTLRLEVKDDAPPEVNWSAGSLHPTAITLDSAPVDRVLISDVLPAGTKLNSPVTGPAGWTPVYATDTASDAPDVSWSTAFDPDATRIGFVNESAIAPGTIVEPFRISVITSEAKTANPAATSIQLVNLAQVFGIDDPDDPNPTLIVDESGDQVPSNLQVDDTDPNNPIIDPDPTTGDPVFEPHDDDGVYDPDNPDPTGNGEDATKNNTGAGPAGEPIVLVIAEPSSLDILNGPNGSPDAFGPDGTQETDFTNKSAFVPPADSVPGSTYNPSPVNFTNTVQNTGENTIDVTLIPDDTVIDTDDLPEGTKIKIIGPDTSEKVYNYIGGVFVEEDNTVPLIKINDVEAGETFDYGVEVDLPDGTPLSTDEDPGEEAGFPVPITAIGDDDDSGPTDDVQNTTIDRVYTGFLKLFKESRILQGDGPAVTAGQDTFSVDPKTPQTGNIIEYRITYTNISEQSADPDNVILDADNVVIVEDGTGQGVTDADNNWALDNDANGVIDTSNVQNSADDTLGGGIDYFSGVTGTDPATDQSGSTANTDVTKYVDTVPGVVSPQESGELTFQRLVN